MASNRVSLVDRETPSGRRCRSLPASQERYNPRTLFPIVCPPPTPLESTRPCLVYRTHSQSESEISETSASGYAGDMESPESGNDSNEEEGSEHSLDETIDEGFVTAYIPEAIWQLVESFAQMTLGEHPSPPESVSSLPDYQSDSNDEEDYDHSEGWRSSASSDSSESEYSNDLEDSAYGSEATRQELGEMITDCDSNDSLLQLNQGEQKNCRKRRFANETFGENDGCAPEKIRKSE